ncbi:MAG: Gfo/Idh/MocA family oxidoreductase, partial [bacterium]|nr:Gfo/Idh/MocA family oxidoreductase [bacterium]
DRAKEDTGGKITTTKRYEEVLNNSEVDAVVLATPDHWHKKMVIDSLEAGKHVYIEKPMTWSVAEGLDIIQAVERTGKTLQVGSQHKTSALTEKAREIVANGDLGKVTMVRMANHRKNADGAWVWPVPKDASPKTVDWDRFLGSLPKKPFDANQFFRWRCWWDYSGGVATDLFVHLLTWMHHVMDVKAPKSAVSQGGLFRWHDGRNVPDVLNTLYEYEKGFVADMYVHLANGDPTPTTTIMGTDGTLEVHGNRLVVRPFTHRPEVSGYGITAWTKAMKAEYYGERGYTAEGRPKKPFPPAKEPKEIRVESRPSHYELFVESLTEGKPSEEDEYLGHYAAGAGHLANIAYRKGRRVQWNATTG